MEGSTEQDPLIKYSRPFNFIIHGWHDGFEGGPTWIFNGPYIDRRGRPELWMEPLAQQWIKHADCNVCIVDWSSLASGGYIDVVKNRLPRVVDDIVNELEIYMERGMNISEVSIVGHSLGAHIAGSVGREFKTHHGIELKAIYGASV